MPNIPGVVPTSPPGYAQGQMWGDCVQLPGVSPALMEPLSYGQLMWLWIRAGGPISLAPTMAAISRAESNGVPGCVQAGQTKQNTGWGLWQITPGTSESQYGTNQEILNPLSNAKAAVAKYRSQGLGAWTTYQKGLYMPFLQAAQAAQPTGKGIPNVTPGNAPMVDPTAPAKSSPSTCAWKIDFPLFGSSCILSESALRGLKGLLLVVGGGIITLVGFQLLLKAAKNQGIPGASGASSLGVSINDGLRRGIFGRDSNGSKPFDPRAASASIKRTPRMQNPNPRPAPKATSSTPSAPNATNSTPSAPSAPKATSSAPSAPKATSSAPWSPSNVKSNAKTAATVAATP